LRKTAEAGRGKSTADDRQCFFVGLWDVLFLKGVFIILNMITIVNDKNGIHIIYPVRAVSPRFLLHGCSKKDIAA
jgi:hypothetical protein